MPNEVREALLTLVMHCIEQDNCSNCPMREMCGKMPCELEFDSLRNN